MNPDIPTLHSATQRYRPLFEAMRDSGIDVDRALAALGFTLAELLDPATRIPRARAVALFRHLLLIANDPELGLAAAARFELPDAGVLGYVIRHSAHALAAIELLSRYARLIADAAECHVACERGEVVVTGGLSGERKFHPLGVDYSAGTLVRIIETLSGGRARPLEVRLCRPRPARLDGYRKLFGDGVSFDAEEFVLRYDEAAMRTPCPHHDPQLMTILEQQAQAMLARLPPSSAFSEQLRGVVERLLARGEASVGAAAQELGLSERTLRRKLSAIGQSYRDVLDEVRREHALALLGEGKLNITDIAQRVGFGDATAFTRSFRRWTGQNPSVVADLRRRQAG